MLQTKVIEIGNITDRRGNQMIRMWTAEVPYGKRPLQRHHHLNFEIMYVNHGSGIYTTQNREYPILPGDIYVFSCNEYHSITNIGESGLKITNLQFNPTFIRNHSQDTIINVNFCFTHHPDFSNRIASSDTGQLLQLLLLIQENLISQPAEYPLAIKSLLQLLLIHLVRDYHYPGASSASHDQLFCIHSALAYLDDHYTEKITLQELATLAGLTPTYFSALFKQVMGIPLWHYIVSKRIDKAAQLITLGDTHRSILDIAIECGFNNTANFNKAFKKHTGMTPREYKNNESSV